MLSFTEDGGFLGCSDCKHKFDSASSLLQHFAHHVSQEARRTQVTLDGKRHISVADQWKNVATTSAQSKKKKTETILEKVLKRNSLRQLSISASVAHSKDNAVSNVSSLSSTPSLVNCDAIRELPNNKLLVDIEEDSTEESLSGIPSISTSLQLTQSAKERNELQSTSTICSAAQFNDIQLAKCDLQTRLENCIVKLVSKQVSDSTLTTESTTMLDSKSISQKESEEVLKSNTGCRKNSINDECNGMSEKFNPMNFCIITLDESENKYESTGNNIKSECVKKPAKISRGASSRKQPSPKRIFYHQNGKLNDLAIRKNAELTVTIVAGCDDKVSSIPPSRKKYPCHLCSKVFGWSTDLKRHILTHTGERPFKCNKCLATFTRNFLLQKHQVKVHRCLPSKQSTISLQSINNLEKYPLKKSVNKARLKFCIEKHEKQSNGTT